MTESFEELVKSAADFTHQLRVLESGRPKLTAKAYLDAACTNGNTNPKRLRALEKLLPQQQMEPLRGFVNRAVAAVRDNFCYPPADLRRIRYLGNDDIAACMAVAGTNYFEAFALACLICTEKHPASFGEVENWPAYQTQVRHIRDTVSAMYVMIATEVKGSDLHIVDGGNGTARVTFAMTAGEVSLYPTRDAGARLVDWVLNHPGMVEAA